MAKSDLLRIFALTAAALALSLLMLAGTKRADAAFPGSAGDLAFHTTRDGNFQVYRIGADGFSPTRLSDTAERNLLPAWSSDGRKVAFVNIDAQNNSDIYVMDHDGQDENPLTEDPAFEYAPAWFPSGNKIAFQRNDGSGSDIYSMTFDDSGTVTRTLRLTRHAAGDGDPVFSPDGKKIAFYSARPMGPVQGDAEIWRMRADGTNPVQLTENENITDAAPVWQPIP